MRRISLLILAILALIACAESDYRFDYYADEKIANKERQRLTKGEGVFTRDENGRNCIKVEDEIGESLECNY